MEILSGVYEGRTTGTPIALLIRNEDQRSKDYAKIAASFRPGHADYTYLQKYGIRDPRGGGRSSARLTAPAVAAGAIARKWLRERYGVDDPRAPHAPRARTRSRSSPGTTSTTNPFFAANATIVPGARGLHGPAAQVRRFLRRAAHRRGHGRAPGLGRAALRPPRRRHRAGDDGHQRREGRGDRRRLRRRRPAGHRAFGRDDARGIPLEPRGRNPRGHLDGPGHRRLDRDQAHVEHPPRAAHRRRGRASRRPSRRTAATIPAWASAPRRSRRPSSRWCSRTTRFAIARRTPTWPARRRASRRPRPAVPGAGAGSPVEDPDPEEA